MGFFSSPIFSSCMIYFFLVSYEPPCDVLWTLLDQFPWLLSEASPSKPMGPVKAIHTSTRQNTVPFGSLPVASPLHRTPHPAT